MTAYTYSGSFPSSPQTNDTLVINDVEYTYTSKGSWAVTGGGILEGTSVRSTGETGAVKFLREDGDGTSSWQAPPGGETLAQTLTIGNTVTAAGKIQFRDTGIYINSSVDGQLDIVADTEIQIATTTIDINGIAKFKSVSRFLYGTVGGPGIAFNGDSNTGFYRIASDHIGISTGGVKRFDINSTAATFASDVTLGDPSVTGSQLLIEGFSSSGSQTSSKIIFQNTTAAPSDEVGGEIRIDTNVDRRSYEMVFAVGDSAVLTDALTINGVDSTATFAGDVTLSSASSPEFSVTDTTNTSTFKIVSGNNSSSIGTVTTGHDLYIQTESVTALTIDGETQDATFAGDIMTGVTSLPSAGEAGTYLAAAGYTYSSRAGTTKAPHFLMTNNNGTAGSLSSSGTGELLISSGTGNTTALTLDNSQNATFAGDVTLGTSSEMVMSRLDGLLVMGTATKPSAQISSSETMLYIEDTSACVIGMNNTGASGENWRLFTDTSGNFRINNQANGNLVTVGATGDATFAGAVTANNTITTIAPDTDHTSFEQIASTTTGAVRQLFKNSNNSKNFELSGFFSSGTEQLAVQSKTNTIARFHHGGSTTFEGDVDMVAGKYLNTGGGSASYHQLYASAISGVGTITATIGGTHGGCVFFNSSSYGANAANTVLVVQKVGATGRSINAGGTINASGADFAEYRELIPALYNNTSAGDLLGYNSEGLLTNVFADVTGRFCIKSTSPAYVGNDIWGNENAIGELPEEPVQDEDTTDEAFADLMVQYELDKEAHALVLEAARVKVDRIAIAGIVPANVTGITVADVGTYLVPTSNEDGTIGAIAIDEDNLTLKQYIKSFGAVERINGDVVMAAVKTC